MSSPDEPRPDGTAAPVESPAPDDAAEAVAPTPAADDPHPGELRSDTTGTGVDSSIVQQEIEPGEPEGAGPAESESAVGARSATAPAGTEPTAAVPEQPTPAEPVADVEVPVAEEPEPTPPPFDEHRSPVVDRLVEHLGDAVVATELIPGRDLWVRVRLDAWGELARVLRDELGFTYFCFLSAVDWLPSPFGKSEDDTVPEPRDPSAPLDHGTTGGDTRFQLLARVESPGTGIGVTVKADVGDDLVAPTWTGVYAGANWHEREAWEMFGITFAGHPRLVHLYLPGAFEGHPLRKDFPLLSRMVKPWPGLVDVEPMPGTGDEPATAEAQA